MKRRDFVLLLLSSPLLANSEFQAFKSEFTNYKKDLYQEFKDFKKVYDEEFKAYKDEILKIWKEAKTTGVSQYVYYSKDKQTRAIVDYKNGELILESQKSSPKDAAVAIKEELETVLDLSTDEAYKKDFLYKVDKKLDVYKELEEEEKIVGDLFSEKEKQGLLVNAKKEIIKDKKTAVKVVIKLPDKSLFIKAKSIAPLAKKYAEKESIPFALVMAIIHSESHFNPLAKSYVPAFGLMQIVPKTAGRDSMKYLTGKDTLLSSSYLYNKENNIKVGTAYLHILMFRYLKDIKDPTSKLYCVISAYNTGAGNVARAFGTRDKAKAIEKINSLSPNAVYRTLLNNLPYEETVNYLQKVNKRMDLYT